MWISVCKNVIMSNNKRNWIDPEPAIRVCKTKAGKVLLRGHAVDITDAEGNVVATIHSTTNGEPILKCGAKVAIETKHPVIERTIHV